MNLRTRTSSPAPNRHRGRLALAVAMVVSAAVLLFVPAAQAQSEGSFLSIRRVTGGSPSSPAATTLDVIFTGPSAELGSAKLVENGQDVTVSAPQQIKPDADMGVIFVIDSGPNADSSTMLVKAREQVAKSVTAHPGPRYGIVQAGDKAEIKLELTTDTAKVVNVLDPPAPATCTQPVNGACAKPASAIAPTKSAAIWNALSLAGGMFAERALQPNIVLITADDSSGSSTDASVGKTAVVGAGATMWSVSYTGSGMDPTAFNDLATSTSGQVLSTDDTGAISGLIDTSMTTIATQQYRLTYNTSVPANNPINLELTVGNQTASADAVSGGGVVQGNALHPQVGSKMLTLPFLDSQLAFLVAMGLALLAIAGIAYAMTLVFVNDDLDNVLSPYADSSAMAEIDDSDDSALGKSALIKRAVSLTEQVAEQQGLLTRSEAALERANLPLRAGEGLFIYLIIVIAATLLPLIIWRNVVPSLIFGILGVLVPPAVVNYLAKRRRKNFMSQLPDTLSLLSGTLRAGYSLMQGVEAVSQEVDEPMGLELRRVVTESRLGRPLEESLEASADRMDSPDFAWAVMAIRIQREVGGNLAELLMTVADTMIARERLRRDVAALTAEGRVSAVILGGLPPMLGLVMYVLNPQYVSVLFTDGLGIAMVIMAVISMIVGFLWMRKIINIEI